MGKGDFGKRGFWEKGILGKWDFGKRRFWGFWEKEFYEKGILEGVIWRKGEFEKIKCLENKILEKVYFGISGFGKKKFKKGDFGKTEFWEQRILGKRGFGKKGILEKGNVGKRRFGEEWEFEKIKIWEKLEFGNLEF